MNKKWLAALLAVATTGACAAALAGCNNGGEHTHTYSESWSYNDTQHYHKCKKEGCSAASDFEDHQTATRTTATCDEAGVKTTYCTVEGCEWSVEEAQDALGHDYEWTFKDNATHTGTCKKEGCTQETPAEAPHRFTESEMDGFTVNTCYDCGVELADVQVNLFKRISDTQTTAYTGATLKVSLYKAGDGNYTKVYEATANPETGVATFKIQEGAYWIKVEDETNGYLSVDSPWIRFNKATAETDLNSRNIILSEPAEYSLKIIYDNDETDPAAGIAVAIYDFYALDGEHPMAVASGTTNENGVVTFTMASSFDLTNSSNLRLNCSGIDKQNYNAEADNVFFGTANGTNIIKIRPYAKSFKINVKMGEDAAAGVTVKLTRPVYDDELKEFVYTVVTSGTTDENGQLVTDVIDNDIAYRIQVELPDNIAADWKVPSTNAYIDLGDEFTVNLIGTPAYILSVNTSSSKEWEKSGIKLTVKDAEDNVVAEGTTNEEGKYTVKLPFAEYKVYVDESTLPEGFAVTTPFTTVPTTGTNNRPTLDTATNSVSRTVTISEIADVAVTVRSGSRNAYVYHENVTVKFYQNGELKYTSQPTDAEGKTTIKGVDGAGYDIVFEGLPENFVCSTTSTTVRASSPTLTATLSESANFALTIKDKDGNALEGATVSLVTYAYSNQGYYTIAEAAKGVTGASGAVNITWLTGKNYTVNVVGADGTKYFAQANLTSATQGETVTQELTVYTYDDEMPLTGNKAPTMYYTGDFIDKEVLVTCSSKREEKFAYMSSDGMETLAAGTYKFEILNPCNVEYKVVTKCGYDEASWGVGVITEPNEYMTFEKDENGNITSVTVNFDNADNKSWFNICITHDVAEGEAATDLFRLIVKVTKVEE